MAEEFPSTGPEWSKKVEEAKEHLDSTYRSCFIEPDRVSEADLNLLMEAILKFDRAVYYGYTTFAQRFRTIRPYRTIRPVKPTISFEDLFS